MKNIILLTSILFLTACGEMNPVDGVPEVIVRNGSLTTVVTQPDGSRIVTIMTGDIVRDIIVLHPSKTIVDVEKDN